MNFFDILSEIENLDPELGARIDSHRMTTVSTIARLFVVAGSTFF